MVLVANPDYWGGAPKLSKVRIQIVPEGSTQRLMLEQGELDAAEGIDTEAIEKLMDTEGVKVVEEPGLAITYMPFNCQKAPFDNVVARQADSYAVDYQAIIDGVALGHAIPLRSPIAKGLLEYWRMRLGSTVRPSSSTSHPLAPGRRSPRGSVRPGQDWPEVLLRGPANRHR